MPAPLEKIIVIVESRQQLDFFRSFVPGLRENNLHAVFLTNKFSVWLVGKFQFGLSISLIEKKNESVQYHKETERSVEILLRFLDTRSAGKLMNAVIKNLEDLIVAGAGAIWVWGGDTIFSQAAKIVSKESEIYFLVFDKGNIDNKMFVDPMGCGVQSWLHRHPEVLTSAMPQPGKVPSGTYSKKFEFNKKKKFNYLLFVDVLYCHFSGIPFVGEKSMMKKVFGKMSRRKSIADTNVPKRPFVYVGMPHSFEMKKSYLSIDDCLTIIDSIIDKNTLLSREVVVTIHPFEYDEEYIDRVQKYSSQRRIILSSLSALDLVQTCEKIYSFNTSVGLYGLMNNVEVEFVEKSLYKGWTVSMAKNYIEGYLLDLFVNDGGYCSSDTVAKVLERMRNA